MMNYEVDTYYKYQDKHVAKIYKEAYSTRLSLKNWRRKLIIFRVRRCIEKALNNCLPFVKSILDIPCGTGVIADILLRNKVSVVAADISEEMMSLAKEDYMDKGNFWGFVRADITKSPFKSNSFDCVIVLGLMHRVPFTVKCEVLKEMKRISKQFIIISFGITNTFQLLKSYISKKLTPGHNPTPCPITFKELNTEIADENLNILKTYKVFSFLSSEIILVLKK